MIVLLRAGRQDGLFSEIVRSGDAAVFFDGKRTSGNEDFRLQDALRKHGGDLELTNSIGGSGITGAFFGVKI